MEQAGCPPTNMVQFEENHKTYLTKLKHLHQQ